MPKAKITRIRYYKAPTDAAGRPNTRQPLFNQSSNVVIIDTDVGISGVGEGGAHDTMEQCAGMLIGEDPFRIEYLWQMLYRGYFYPAGREKVHALGALDVALWGLKGKALGVPVYQLLGGRGRDHVECYSTGWPGPGTPVEKARACIDLVFGRIAFLPTWLAVIDSIPSTALMSIAARFEKAQARMARGALIFIPNSICPMPFISRIGSSRCGLIL